MMMRGALTLAALLLAPTLAGCELLMVTGIGSGVTGGEAQEGSVMTAMPGDARR